MGRFDPFPTLYTERLELRRLGPDDVDVVFRLQSDPEVVKYFGRAPYRTRAEAEKRVADEIAAVEQGVSVRWGLAPREGGAIVGTAGFWRWDQGRHLAEIGYELAPEHWGRGLIVEALRAIVRYGFAELGLHRVEANLDPANVRSARALEKLGFVREGVLRQNWFYDGAYTDSAAYGLLASEFEGQAPAAR
jgi:ribosomal-protein-alanine N-acetyltransferase